MNLRNEFFVPLAWRIVISAVPFSIGWWMVSRTMITGDANIVMVAIAVVLMTAPGFIIAPPIARFLGNYMGSLFYPDATHVRPPPVYSLPRARRIQGHFEESLALYRKIVEEHPQETQAYLDMLDITIDDLRDFARAEKIAHSAIAVLKSPQDRARIRRRMREGGGEGKTVRDMDEQRLEQDRSENVSFSNCSGP
jgi:hypothetical protein